jgi:hypothetical protein
MAISYRLESPYHLDERKVKHRMIDLGLSGADIARRVGTTEATITRHIKGQRRNPAVQKAIARVLKVRLDEIVCNGINGKGAAA